MAGDAHSAPVAIDHRDVLAILYPILLKAEVDDHEAALGHDVVVAVAHAACYGPTLHVVFGP